MCKILSRGGSRGVPGGSWGVVQGGQKPPFLDPLGPPYSPGGWNPPGPPQDAPLGRPLNRGLRRAPRPLYSPGGEPPRTPLDQRPVALPPTREHHGHRPLHATHKSGGRKKSPPTPPGLCTAGDPGWEPRINTQGREEWPKAIGSWMRCHRWCLTGALMNDLPMLFMGMVCGGGWCLGLRWVPRRVAGPRCVARNYANRLLGVAS